MLTILYFGKLSDIASRRQDELDLPDGISSLEPLKKWLDSEHDLQGALNDPSIKTMVNQTLVHDDLTLSGTEEIGFLPPVGGG